MIDTDALQAALHLLFGSWTPWLVVIPGLIVGLVFGAVPGLSISTAMVLALPFTLTMDFVPAMLLLTAIWTGGTTGNGFPAVLLRIPGGSSGVATTFDGYPMTRRGLHNEALGITISASAFAEALAYILLFFLLVPIAFAVVRLGPPEMLLVVLWALTLIAVLSGRYFSRALLSGGLGLLVGSVGLGVLGHPRGTLGIDQLLDGIPAIPAIIGVFLALDIFVLAAGYLIGKTEARRLNFGKIVGGMLSIFRYPVVLIRGGVIGAVVGAAPGVGSSVASLLAYSEARRNAKDAASFGTGNPKGLVAAESANSSSEAGALATLLSLGIPASAGGAVLLTALQMHGVAGGPRFVAEQRDVVYAIIGGNLFQTILIIPLGAAFAYAVAATVAIPGRILTPIVLVTATLGTYGIAGGLVGPLTLLAFILIGRAMHKYDYPAPAFVIGLLLARPAEGELLRSYQLLGGDISYIFDRPITLALLALIALVLAWRAFRGRRSLTPTDPE